MLLAGCFHSVPWCGTRSINRRCARVLTPHGRVKPTRYSSEIGGFVPTLMPYLSLRCFPLPRLYSVVLHSWLNSSNRGDTPDPASQTS